MRTFQVVPYDPSWPMQFEHVAGELLSVFAGATVEIQHIGSTSVPGLPAKPVIDVLLGATTLAEIEARIAPLAAFGYAYVSKYERELPQRRYFVRPETSTPRVHVHGVVRGDTLWRHHIWFRDALRADDGLRDAYAALKQRLAKQFAHDKAAYTAAKDPFIRSVLATAP
jgi:GrpB-like predicted nucleotidyltransferase (UPF0157 family)